MTKAQLISSDDGTATRILLERRVSGPALELLTQTVWGSRDMKYRITDVASKLELLRDPHVFTLWQGGALATVCVLDRCSKTVLGRPCDCFHFAMIATAPGSRQKGLASRLATEIQRFCRETLGQPGMGFAYIEGSTEFSLQISERLGYTLDAELPLTLFSRLFPSDDPRVGRMTQGERGEVLGRLETLYSGEELTDFDLSLKSDACFVLREGDRVLASVQVEMLSWSVVSLPGIKGRLLLSLLPHVPVLNRKLDPRHLRFLRFGNILCEEGYEDALQGLLEAVLARQNAAMGLILMDRRSAVLGRILSKLRLGPLKNALTGSVRLHADFTGLSREEVARLAQRPVLMSPADVF